MHVVGTAGHVDHGKSTLVEALTGIDPDRFAEEKRRGLTIDLGFAWCTLPSGREIGIVDVPGHERFIRNMLAGVGSIDAALFVVAADEGFMPQSEEHLQILDFLVVERAVVAITKGDLADDDLAGLVAEEVTERLARTTLAGAPVVAVSAVTRSGIDELLAALDATLEEAGPPDDRGRPRLFVDRSFTIAGAGTVVTGTLTGGRLSVGQEVRILPDGLRARVRSLQTHRSAVDEASPGSRVAANLAGLERTAVRRGDALVADDWILSDRFVARLRAAAAVDHPLAEKSAYELFVGSAQTPCRIRFVDGTDRIAPGGDALVEIFTRDELPVVPGDRFVVRDVGRWQTVAGGRVIDQSPPRLRRGDERALERLRRREPLGANELAAWLIADRVAVAPAELAGLTGAGRSDVDAAIAESADRIGGDLVVAKGRVAELERSVLDAVRAHRTEHPLAPGLPSAELARATGIDGRIADALVHRLEQRGEIARDGSHVRLPETEPQLSDEHLSVRRDALERLRLAGASPPPLAELGLTLELAKALERLGDIVVIGGIAYAADVWATIERTVAALIARGGPVTVAQVRDAVATSRKYAVPMLERLDATGITRRKGDVRELGPRGVALAGERPV